MKKFYLVLGLLFSPALAHAGPFVEPYLGYVVDKTTVTTGSIAVAVKASGLTYGARAGLRGKAFGIGGEFQGASLKPETGGASSTFSGIGATAILYLPFSLRGWVTYFFSAKRGSTKGSGFKVGGGLRLTHHISLNGELAQITYDTTASTKDQAAIASISFPFDFR